MTIYTVEGLGDIDLPDGLTPEQLTAEVELARTQIQGPAVTGKAALGEFTTPERRAELADQAQSGPPVNLDPRRKLNLHTAEMVGREGNLPPGLDQLARFGLGGAESISNTRAAAMQMLGMGDERDQNRVQANRDTNLGLAGGAGKLATDIGTVAAPGALAARTAMLVKMMRAAPITTAATTGATIGAAEGALRPTLGDESRAKNTATGAAYGAGGGVLPGAAAASARLMGRSPLKMRTDMQQVIEKFPDVTPTVGQGVDRDKLVGWAVGKLEDRLRIVTQFGQKRARTQMLTSGFNTLLKMEERPGVRLLVAGNRKSLRDTASDLAKHIANNPRDAQARSILVTLREAQRTGGVLNMDVLRKAAPSADLPQEQDRYLDLVDSLFPAPEDAMSGDALSSAVGAGAGAYLLPTTTATTAAASVAGSSLPGARMAFGLTKPQKWMAGRPVPGVKSSALPAAVAASVTIHNEP